MACNHPSCSCRKKLYCDFCGKRQDEVEHLIAGPAVYICNECVDLCAVVIDQRKGVIASSDEIDARRYRWLRSRDVNAIHAGGVFAGMTPVNVVMNGADLDAAVDQAMAASQPPPLKEMQQ